MISDIAFFFKELTHLSSVGPRTEVLLQKLLKTSAIPRVIDLLKHLPTSVVDRRYTPNLCDVRPQSIATLTVTIMAHYPPARRGLPYKVLCQDDTGEIQLIFFRGNKSYIQQHLPLNQLRIISGKVDIFQGKKQITHPDYICPLSQKDQIPLIEPLYPLTAGVHQKALVRLFQQIIPAIPKMDEWIDAGLLAKKKWPSFWEALQYLHQPTEESFRYMQSRARERLAYDECLANQMALHLLRFHHRKIKQSPLSFSGQLKRDFIHTLPFQLTSAQKTVLNDIQTDLTNPYQMTRLLQGDVGSGKTVVALASMLDAVEAGYQAVLMVPIDLLARQHYEKALIFLAQHNIHISCLTGREKGKVKEKIYQDIAEGKSQIIIGTHAVFQEKVHYARLGYVVIDEQHRFGVEQRIQLMQKGQCPNLLVMTATPIPRTLQMTQYGDMDVSYLSEKPVGRQKISTHLIDIEQMEKIIPRLQQKLNEGAKIYWVCPLVEESEKISKTAAEERYRYLKHLFGSQVGLVHGKMKAADKDSAMAQFIKKEGDDIVNILVSTTVIEVGMDVKEATIMVIEHAEQFGLAQLHQLRGRVGRGHESSYCLLLYQTPLSHIAKQRLQMMRNSDNGFLIAEEDLKLRGGGNVLGTQQSGFPDSTFFDMSEHQNLIPLAKKQAQILLEKDAFLESFQGQCAKNLLTIFERKQALKYLVSG